MVQRLFALKQIRTPETEYQSHIDPFAGSLERSKMRDLCCMSWLHTGTLVEKCRLTTFIRSLGAPQTTDIPEYFCHTIELLERISFRSGCSENCNGNIASGSSWLGYSCCKPEFLFPANFTWLFDEPSRHSEYTAIFEFVFETLSYVSIGKRQYKASRHPQTSTKSRIVQQAEKTKGSA